MLYHVPAHVSPKQVEFPKSVREKSLHVSPISTLELTESEHAHLKEKEPELFAALIEIRKTPTLEDRLAQKAKASPVVEEKEAEAPAEPEAPARAPRRTPTPR